MSSELPVGYAARDTGADSDHGHSETPSPPFRGGYDDSHDANSLTDFGLDVPIDWYQGIVISTDELHSYFSEDEFTVLSPQDHEYLIIQPIGVGPSINHSAGIPGEEPVFVNVYGAREYDFPGESYRLDAPQPDTLQLTRRNIDKLSQIKPVVQQLKHGKWNAPEHWQNPDDDPDNLVEL